MTLELKKVLKDTEWDMGGGHARRALEEDGEQDAGEDGEDREEDPGERRCLAGPTGVGTTKWP